MSIILLPCEFPIFHVRVYWGMESLPPGSVEGIDSERFEDATHC